MAARAKERANNGERKGERSAAGVEEYCREKERDIYIEREREGAGESETGRTGAGRQERARKREYQETEAAA